jgi:hypothetical protein
LDDCDNARGDAEGIRHFDNEEIVRGSDEAEETGWTFSRWKVSLPAPTDTAGKRTRFLEPGLVALEVEDLNEEQNKIAVRLWLDATSHAV